MYCGTAIKDEDDMSSAAAIDATQQSIKAYVDAQVATEDTNLQIYMTQLDGKQASGHILIYDAAGSGIDTLTAKQ